MKPFTILTISQIREGDAILRMTYPGNSVQPCIVKETTKEGKSSYLIKYYHDAYDYDFGSEDEQVIVCLRDGGIDREGAVST